jgi:hypothetical protein
LNQRRREIISVLQPENINAKIFFFPNDRDPGELETLLLKLIPVANRYYFTCFNAFDDCIDNNIHSKTSLKDRFHAYCCSLLEEREHNQRRPLVYPSGDYFKERFFDVNSVELNALKDFLREHLS